MAKRMIMYSLRLPEDLAAKVKALAHCYGERPGQFLRDWLEAGIEGGVASRLFGERLAGALHKYAQRAVPSGSGGFTALGQSVPAARKELRKAKRRKKPV